MVTKEFIDIGNPDLHVSVVRYGENLSSPWHFHEKTYFTFIQKGGNVEHKKDSSVECRAGMLFMYNSDSMHYNDKGRNASKNFNIEIEDVWFHRYEIDRTNFSGVQAINDNSVRTAFQKIWTEVNINDAHSSMAIEGYLLQVFSCLLRSNPANKKNEPAWVALIREYFNSGCLKDISLDSLSRTASLHPVTLSREFPVYFGTGFSEYARDLKCERARQLMHKRSIPLQEIAVAAGFCDASHLISTFKKKFNITPAKYRSAL